MITRKKEIISCNFDDLKDICKYKKKKSDFCKHDDVLSDCNMYDCPFIEQEYVSCCDCKYLNANSITSCVKKEICMFEHYKSCDDFIDKYDRSHEVKGTIRIIEHIIDKCESNIIKAPDIVKGMKLKLINPNNTYVIDKDGNDIFIAKGYSYFSIKDNNWIIPIYINRRKYGK
jgi:hypothetical protein